MHKNVQVMSFKNYENNSKIVKVMIKNRVVPFYLEHGVHCTSKNNTLVLGKLWQMLTDFHNSFSLGLSDKFAERPLLYFLPILSLSLHEFVKYKRSKIVKL